MKKSFAEIIAVASVFQLLTTKHYNNFSLSYKIAKASRELEEKRSFYSNEERKIVETYAIKDDKGNVKIVDGNRVTFKTQEDANKFNEEVIKLQKTEVDVFDPIVISVSDIKKEDVVDLTPANILALEGFVIFKDYQKDSKKEA